MKKNILCINISIFQVFDQLDLLCRCDQTFCHEQFSRFISCLNNSVPQYYQFSFSMSFLVANKIICTYIYFIFYSFSIEKCSDSADPRVTIWQQEKEKIAKSFFLGYSTQFDVVFTNTHSSFHATLEFLYI